jgi:hypothetical protein
MFIGILNCCVNFIAESCELVYAYGSSKLISKTSNNYYMFIVPQYLHNFVSLRSSKSHRNRLNSACLTALDLAIMPKE